MTEWRIAIIGDRFMLPDMFRTALDQALDVPFEVRVWEQAWPDVPMVHGYDGGDTQGLKEFLGEPDEVAAFIGDADILVNHLAPVTDGVVARCPNLKFIGVSRGGPVNIAMDAVRARGVTVCNAPGRNATAVAEFTVGMILAETRLITKGHMALTQGIWRGDLYRADVAGEELCDMTVGLIGYGRIGSRLPALLKPFGCRILADDPYVDIDPADGVEQVDLDTLLAESDIVSMHPRVTEETTGMIGREQFARMKDGAYFINTARGPLVDYEALYEALTSGKLRGAGIETFAVEPVPPKSPLLQLPNVTLTPHIAGSSVRTVRYAAGLVAEDVRRFIAGEPLVNPV